MTYVESLVNKAIAQSGTPGNQMSQQAFAVFYDRTAAALLAHIVRIQNRRDGAEDVLQETYLRFLGAPFREAEDRERISFLYRISTNLIFDHWRRSKFDGGSLEDLPGVAGHLKDPSLPADMSRLFASLNPRERALLWHAYVEGADHRELAILLGVNALSVRVMLFRAKRKMEQLLLNNGYGPKEGN